jgi:hypothetical protein
MRMDVVTKRINDMFSFMIAGTVITFFRVEEVESFLDSICEYLYLKLKSIKEDFWGVKKKPVKTDKAWGDYSCIKYFIIFNANHLYLSTLY